MKNVVPTTYLPDECYVLEVDGKIKSKHGAFIEALKAGLELKRKFPQGEIKVHDANANAS